jgi:hypothetical protein
LIQNVIKQLRIVEPLFLKPRKQVAAYLCPSDIAVDFELDTGKDYSVSYGEKSAFGALQTQIYTGIKIE